MTLKELCEKTGLTAGNIEFYRKAGVISFIGEPGNDTIITEEECENVKKVAALRKTGVSCENIMRLQKGRISLSKALAERDRDKATVSTDLVAEKLLEDGDTYDDIHADYILMTIANETAGGGRFTDIASDSDDAGSNRRALTAFIAAGVLLLFINLFPGKSDFLHSGIFAGVIIVLWGWMYLTGLIERTEFPEKAAKHKRIVNLAAGIILAAAVAAMILLP